MTGSEDANSLVFTLVIYPVEPFITGFLLEKNLRGGGAKDNRPLFFRTIGCCFYCSFYCFSKILGGKRLLGGEVVFWGGRPPVAESQTRFFLN